MTFGKARPALSLSFSYNTRRVRLGVSHSGSASSWVAPTKEPEPTRAPGRDKNGKRSHR